MTNVPSIDLQIYDPCATPRWRDFDPTVPVHWPEDVPILLKQATLPDDACVGLCHFVEKLQAAVSSSTEIMGVSERD
jgi:hypothetical protein